VLIGHKPKEKTFFEKYTNIKYIFNSIFFIY
jgi:hypothetical protein